MASIIKKIEESGSVQGAKKRDYHRNGHCQENIVSASQSVVVAPKTSIRH